MEAINRVGRFFIDLIDDSTIKIKKARANHKHTNFNSDLILIDNLAGGTRVGSSDSFNGDTENMNYSTKYNQVFTLDFYGQNAYDLAVKTEALIRSQKSYNLQRANGLSVYRATDITNLRQLTGDKFYERYQVELNIQYWNSTEIPTLRIDELNLDTITVDQ